MNKYQIAAINAQSTAAQSALRELNNANAVETSYLTPPEWQELIDTAYSATCVLPNAALLIAYDQTAEYDAENFRWFQDRYATFVYVDRIVVAETHRGAGLARMLYNALFEQARANGATHVTCEVNYRPPNPGSDAFHTRMGFSVVGQADLSYADKTVRYCARELT